MNRVQLNTYKVSISIGAGKPKQILWYFTNWIVFKSSFPFPSSLKSLLLKSFGATIGLGVRIKPAVNIKFPWKLSIGNHCWIGEKVWIDNLEPVIIGNDCCLSQGCMLLTGSHDPMKSGFDYTSGPIILEDGVWIGAKGVVTSGVTCFSHSILGANSVADKNLESFIIYKGNPCIPVLKRVIK